MQATLLEISRSASLAESKKDITSLTTQAYLIDLGQFLAANLSTQRRSFTKIALAIRQDHAQDRLNIIVLLER